MIPASDSAFRRQACESLERSAARRPEDLEDRLRRLFPKVVVRERGLSGEPSRWYVYRDGIWTPDETPAWWSVGGLPMLRLTRDGWIMEATPAALSILGISAGEIADRHYTDFVATGTLADASHLFGLVADGQALTATVILQPALGQPIAVDLRAELVDGLPVAIFRLADGIDLGPATVREAPVVTALPHADLAFHRYVEVALGRMSEPTPEGLALRLRRLYPHAYVALEGDGWVARRDGVSTTEPSPNTGHWWADPTLPRVRYDARALIIEANTAATALLGATLVGHHWQEFVTPGTTDQVSTMLAILADAGAAESRFRMPSHGGALVEFDSYTFVDGEMYTTMMRPCS